MDTVGVVVVRFCRVDSGIYVVSVVNVNEAGVEMVV